MQKNSVSRRRFIKTAGSVTGMVLGHPGLWAQQNENTPKTNIQDAMGVKRTAHSLPGAFPGRVIETHHPEAMSDNGLQPERVETLFHTGLQTLCGRTLQECFDLFFTVTDQVGIKVNPVGAGLISTRIGLVEAIIDWLTSCGLPRHQITIWDRFDYMLKDAGFTPERFPGIRIAGLQTMDEAAMQDKSGNPQRWQNSKGQHVSHDQFDQHVFYWADVQAPQDDNYLNQHVFNNKFSYFGKLLTQELTKIINVPVFKNTGNGISMATKNLGYGSICNTGRLHRPLFFNVCTEVLAFPVLRDKLVLNITDGLRAQYDGGPGPAAQFTTFYNRLFFATDPFALDRICHDLLVTMRKEKGIDVNEHPRFTQYLRYAEELGLGIVNPGKTEHIRV
ncbi:DUF362 domain-containing protein [candidate division KSB1 bacterium]|nr:DUF362 domain-containing protein [candidate division KSB1 bacterium]